MQKNSHGKIDILLVDDNSTDSGLIVSTLQKAAVGNQIHVLTDASKTLDFALRQGSFSKEPPFAGELLVLLSLNHAGVHGLEVLRKLKSDERTRSVPVIILTASQEERGVMEAYKIGANACIVKPLDLRKLIEAVAESRLGWLLIATDEENSGEAI